MQVHPIPPSPGVALGAPPRPGAAHSIQHGPSFAMLQVDLAPGQTLIAEAGAMVLRHQQVGMQVKLNSGSRGGFIATLKAIVIALVRRFIGGETFFINHFSASAPGSVWLAPALSGGIQHRRMQGETIVLSRGAYLAHVGDIDIHMRFGGLRGLLAKEGVFFLEVSGHGDLWFTSYGGVEVIDIDGTFLVDNGHLVGYEGQLDFKIRSAGGGVLGFVASGEGLVCEFSGRGRIYLQSRNLGALVDWLTRLLP
jgi:uncharacterized protein (TIGR00266 family)